MTAPAPYIGPETVGLRIRTDTGAVDAHGHPVRDERIVTKSNASISVTSTFERRDTGNVAVYNASAALPVDADTRALSAADAIEYDGRIYEMQGDGTVWQTLAGDPDHVRAIAILEVPIDTRREQVIVTPKGGRTDQGAWLPDGEPVPLMACGVTPGNTARTYGARGTLDAADFTVALDADAPCNDGDEMTVRGVTGFVRVVREFEPWANRTELIVTVEARSGGRR